MMSLSTLFVFLLEVAYKGGIAKKCSPMRINFSAHFRLKTGLFFFFCGGSSPPARDDDLQSWVVLNGFLIATSSSSKSLICLMVTFDLVSGNLSLIVSKTAIDKSPAAVPAMPGALKCNNF